MGSAEVQARDDVASQHSLARCRSLAVAVLLVVTALSAQGQTLRTELQSIMAARELSPGTLLVTDARAGEVRRLLFAAGKAGELVAPKGAGPAHTRAPTDLVPASRDTLAVVDWGNSKLLLIGPDGRVAREISMALYASAARLTPPSRVIALTAEDAVLARLPARPWEQDATDTLAVVTRLHRPTAMVADDSLLRVRTQRVVVRVVQGTLTAEYDPDGTADFVVGLGSGTFAWLSPNLGLVRWYGFSGDVLERRLLSFQRRKMSNAERKSAAADAKRRFTKVLASGFRAGGGKGATVTRALSSHTYWPLFDEALAGTSGVLVLRLTRGLATGDRRVYVIVSRAPARIRCFMVDSKFRVVAVGSSHAYLQSEAEDGAIVVEMIALERLELRCPD